MNFSQEDKFNAPLIVLIITSIILSCIIYLSSTDPLETNVWLVGFDYVNFDDDWLYTNEAGETSEVTFPAKLDVGDDTQVILERTLPEAITASECLSFRSTHTQVHVYIDQALVYTYGETSSPIFDIPGCAWNFIPLTESDAGKTIRIVYTSPINKYAGKLSNCYFGDKTDLTLRIVEQNFFGTITCIIILAMSIVLFIIWLMTRRIVHGPKILYLSIVTFLAFFWSITETQVLQYFLGNMQIVSMITYEVLMIVPFPVVGFFSLSDSRRVRIASHLLLWVSFANFIVCNVLFFTRLVQLGNSLVLTHITLLMCITGLISAHIIDYIKAPKGMRHFKIDNTGFILFMSAVVLDLLRYYFVTYNDSSLFTRIGMLVYILTLALDCFKEAFAKMLLAEKAKVYERLAYTDANTGLLNRTAFNERVDYIDSHMEQCKDVVILNVDINNLKMINDTYGHDKGDEYIQSNVNLLTQYFGTMGECYRIGGDEFCVIIDHYNERELNNRLYAMHHQMAFSKGMQDFSFGYASFENENDTIHDVIKRADERMYEYKKNYKKRSKRQARSS